MCETVKTIHSDKTAGRQRTVVLKREKGNVTIFAFDEAQGLREHTSPFDALVQAVEGDAEIMVAGKAIVVKAGDIILLPAEKRYDVKATTQFKMVLTMILLSVDTGSGGLSLSGIQTHCDPVRNLHPSANLKNRVWCSAQFPENKSVIASPDKAESIITP